MEKESKPTAKAPLKAIRLRDLSSVKRILARVCTGLQRDTVTPSTARAITGLTRVFCDAVKSAELEKRIESIESTLIQRGKIKE